MKKVVFWFLMVTVVMQFSSFVFGAIPAEERAALIALYNSTNGDGWTNNTGWKTPPLDSDGFAMPGTEGDWFGVSVAGDHVIELNQNQNNLVDYIPSQLGNLTNLQTLILSQNYLSGSIPSELVNLTSLAHLDLSSNQLSGSISALLCNLSNLQHLNLRTNQFRGKIPSELGNLRNLKYLNLNDNPLSGTIPPQFGNLMNLEYLYFSSGYLSGIIPPELGKLTNLKELVICGGELSGIIPPELGKLTNLKELVIAGGRLSGSIPNEFWKLINLRVLGLSFLRLSGSIPNDLGKLTNLQRLVLSLNEFVGNIPPQLGNLTNLKEIDLSYNNLSGSIPPQLGNLTNLKVIDISNNQLSGNIPSSLINLINVYNLQIEYNCLTATDPALRSWLTELDPYWDVYQDECAKCENKSFQVGNLTFYADSVCQSGNVFTLKGNVNINKKLWLSGDVEYTKGSDSSGTLVSHGYPFVKLSKGNQSILTASDLVYNVNGISNKLTPIAQNIIFGVMLNKIPVKMNTDPIVITDEEVLLNGKISIGSANYFLCDIDVEMALKPGDKIHLNKAGISAKSSSKIPGFKISSVSLNYNDKDDELTGNATLEFPFLGLKEIEASITVQPGCLDGFSIEVALKNSILIGSSGITIDGFILKVDNICRPHEFKIFFGGNLGIALIPSAVLSLEHMGLGYEQPFRFNIESGDLKFFKSQVFKLNGYIDASNYKSKAGIGINGNINFGGLYTANVDMKLLFQMLKFNGKTKGTLQIPDFSCESWQCKVIKAIITHFIPLPYNLLGQEMDIEIWDHNGNWTGALKGMTTILSDISLAVGLKYDNGTFNFQIGTNFEDMLTVFDKRSRLNVMATAVEQSINLPSSQETIIFSAGSKTNLPQIYLKTPSGETITPSNVNNFSGVTYIENSKDFISLFMLNSASAGEWTIGVNNLSSSEVNFGIYAKRALPKTSFTNVSKSGNNFNISASVSPVKNDINVSLFFSERSAGGTGSLIADKLSASSGTISTTWDTSSVPSGTYYLFAKTDDNLNAPVLTYYDSPIVIDNNGIKAPQNFHGSSSGDIVELTWTPSTSSSVVGYKILYTDEPQVGGYKYQKSAVANNQATIAGLNQSKSYRFCVVAFDGSGNCSIESNTYSVAASGTPQISLNHTSLNFGAVVSGNNPNPQAVMIGNSGTGTLDWSASSNAAWLSITPSSGTGDSVLSVSANVSGLAVGNYTGTITITDENASNSPQTVTVTLKIYEQGKTSAPFGDFATPTDGSTVSNSIPVTGWALDDIGVANVKIYNGNSYVGDAVFVEGARPDVETAFPNYPNNYKAGWGYMLLTHFLPNGGNGTYTIIAKATDAEGNEVNLGSKTITVDNAHANRPFGAIDTPEQGGTASGASFVNFGWALTPQPNSIKTDGTTINVIIDSVSQGHAGYNQLRSDIASLFPGFNNTNGAGGYFYIDTTKLKNGIHTIAWDVTDNNGNSDGIGSRYFNVMNTGTAGDPAISSASTASNTLQTGTSTNECDIETFEIKELERLEIRFADLPNVPTHHLSGYLIVGYQLRECPVGSTLDKEKGIFYWQPGPGFVGKYRFVFTGEDENGQYVQKNIIVNIKPRF